MRRARYVAARELTDVGSRGKGGDAGDVSQHGVRTPASIQEATTPDSKDRRLDVTILRARFRSGL
jgi:hypothetical protein